MTAMPERPPVPDDPAERIRIKRIYRAVRVSDGKRILVDHGNALRVLFLID